MISLDNPKIPASISFGKRSFDVFLNYSRLKNFYYNQDIESGSAFGRSVTKYIFNQMRIVGPGFPVLSFNPTGKEEIATKIRIIYDRDLNIIDIHNHVAENFALKKALAPNLIAQAKKILESSKSSHLTINSRRSMERESEKLLKTAKTDSDESVWDTYYKSVEKILVRYNNYNEIQKDVISFGGNETRNDQKINRGEKISSEDLQEIISEFLKKLGGLFRFRCLEE